MRKIQKVIIIIYCMVVAVACIYVPWKSIVPIQQSLSLQSAGYCVIWQPWMMSYEKVPSTSYSYWVSEPETIYLSNSTIIDFQRVILELIAITAIFGILFILTLKSKRVSESQLSQPL